MAVTGNIFTDFTDGVDYGFSFNANEFSYAEIGGTALGSLNIDQNGDITYTPDPSEIPGTGTNTVCKTVMFTQNLAGSCACTDVASICFEVPAAADPCAANSHCGVPFTDAACTDAAQFNLFTVADGIASCVIGYTAGRTYSWNSVSAINNYAGADPTVDGAGDFYYKPDESEAGGSAVFAIDVTEGACTSTFALTVSFSAFCDQFFVNDITIT